MTQKILEFHFDFASPSTYLAYTQVQRIANETGAKLVLHPMLLGGVFKATGNVSPITVPAKGIWMESDLTRWARHWGVLYQMNPFFPINTLPLMRGACGMLMDQPADFLRYVDSVFKAMWVDSRNMGEPEVIASFLVESGFDAAAFMAMVVDPRVKADLVMRTEASVARGVFGAPTFFVADQIFFGQDRLQFVQEALAMS
jgi:2-hydroxychromene-2-carboxylate isomerase